MESLNASSLKTPTSHKQRAPANPNLSSKVRVITRVRLLLPRETSSNTEIPNISVLDRDSNAQEQEVTVLLKDPSSIRRECYQLDSFFGPEDNNVSLIFEREVKPLIPGIFCGHNATVFAYGATGSGKTYTMQGTDEFPGLMPLSMSTIMSICQRTGSTVEISYYEVYIEKCYDLLHSEEAREVMILDDKDGHILFKGLTQVSVNSLSEFQEVFSRGIQRRKTAHTGLNDVSSRSHGVLVIGVTTQLSDGSGSVVKGKINLIDLAGNEDNRRTCNEGIRLLESAKINQSLFALSKVIFALNNNDPRIPYRESKLTRILQDSLGGTSRSVMVACLNPGEYQESVRTVSLAAKSRLVSNLVSSSQKLATSNSSQKLGTSKDEVNMEEKLRLWLESKGKSKGTQRPRTHSSPFLGRSIKKPDYQSSVKAKVNTHRGTSNAKERIRTIPLSNLFNDEGLTDYLLENLNSAAKDNTEEITADSVAIGSKSTTHLPSKLLDKPEGMSPIESDDSFQSPLSEKKKTMQSPLRPALSPIDRNCNRKIHEEVASVGHKPRVLVEPKTPYVETCGIEQFGTPLEKFTAISSGLKTSLMQEYVDILNTASREELQLMKGIGVKLAEYIVELRETSPLKSLSDLEKIGLSSKQVHNLFSKAAQGIFEKQSGVQGETPTYSGAFQVK